MREESMINAITKKKLNSLGTFVKARAPSHYNYHHRTENSR